MRKLIIFAVSCLCCANAVNAQERCQYKAAEIDEASGTVKSTGQPVNGVVCSYDDNLVIMEMPFKDGKKEGIQKWYHENGNLRLETPYKDNKQEGFARHYYESGKLWWETPYKDGKVEGVERWYYESGPLQEEFSFKNGKQDGYRQIYTESGRLLMKLLYRNDRPVSGACGDGRAFTNAEIMNYNMHTISCKPQ